MTKKVVEGPDRTVGTDRTNRRGRWLLTGHRDIHGRFYARTITKRFTSFSGAVIECRSASSKAIIVDD